MATSYDRKGAEAYILKWVGKLDPSGENAAMLKEQMAALNDKEFEAWMIAISKEEDFVPLNYTNLKKSKITVDNNLKIADEMGVKLFQRLRMTDSATGMTFLTPKAYLLIDMPVRRQIQLLRKKISVASDNRHVDELTDQMVGDSKGSSLSFPEMLTLNAQGHTRSIEEMLRFRGGNLKANNAMDRQIAETGHANMDYLGQDNSKVKATVTMSIYLKSMLLDNNYV